MGPAIESKSLTTRPEFTWGLNNSPWTEGYRNKKGLAKQVEKWIDFHDSLYDNNNNNKISQKQLVFILHSNYLEDRKIALVIFQLSI